MWGLLPENGRVVTVGLVCHCCVAVFLCDHDLRALLTAPSVHCEGSKVLLVMLETTLPMLSVVWTRLHVVRLFCGVAWDCLLA
jgi:hypothetical protein